MLDLKYIREHTDRVRQKMAERGQTVDLEGLLRADRERRELIVRGDELKQRRNAASDEITRLKQQRQSVDTLLTEMKQVSERIKQLDEQIRSLDEQLQERLLYLPNLLHDSVPVGKDEKENKEIRRWGTQPSLDFPKGSHWEIGEKLGILDFERAARVTGARFVFYKGLGARLERALLNFMLDLHVREHGYEEILPPVIVNRASMIGTGQLPKFEEDLFRLLD